MVLASDYDQSRWFKAIDLKMEKKLRIKSVTEEMIGMEKEKAMKLVVWFTNDKKGLPLNRVNNRTIRAAYGDDVSGWVGKIIIVFPTMAEFRGNMGPALRVRIPAPKQPTAESPAVPQHPSGNSANGAAAIVQQAATPAEPEPPLVHPELEPDPVMPETDDDLEDSTSF